MKRCKKCNKYYTDGTYNCKVCGEPLDYCDMVGGADDSSLKKSEMTSDEKFKKFLLCAVVCIAVMFGVSYIFVVAGAAKIVIFFLILEYLLLKYICKFIWNRNREIIIDNKKIDNMEETKVTIETVYFYIKDSEIMGPCTSQHIKDLDLEKDVLIMNNKDEKWVKYAEIEKLL